MHRIIEDYVLGHYIHEELCTVISYIVILTCIILVQNKSCFFSCFFVIASFLGAARILYLDINDLYGTLFDPFYTLIEVFDNNSPQLFSWIAEVFMVVSLVLVIALRCSSVLKVAKKDWYASRVQK